ncbi:MULTISPECIES: MBL fold metallo-hydrolase [unclassified Polaromonas]|jgi:glyoxylase-like metal-dependent hydrolase (beta-lactamase superfamily II)|uniref:MBL fold metallo-hydrolase n=1 Tax=unclassified Polaromonas TaxID=2638319 RepID=UPI000BDC2E61|nr:MULTISPECIES: MBL fold metallo-hydrolase [unclassified Polaromonas]OYY38036.1 MAG: MBL fold metallo-hydrolase [Polaromonas sp. 35-63-35]OYZ18479.1 MAG: MBL fold metallo-hydrolase [Polaromonas sp. 16-63-31]OYZ79584.1 MAG: MBL fold metallo-hydrolase [Polaromonas sp. 24-63-21]OZA50731.1 MAG: MBL fold metallo-hydrolase [Polaromonas sp. 17-63-33]OZA89588.1 MAG: MBL fold metallo-hydrolase [Polaromonas sp. 39-63-25]
MTPIVTSFFDPDTWTVSHVVHEKEGGACAIVDAVLDYDARSGRTRTTSADKLAAFVQQNKLQVAWILETHAHADHLSAAHYLRGKLGGKIAIGAAITQVQTTFKRIFNLEPGFQTDGRQFDRLLQDGETLAIGALQVRALSVPGHTPACMAYLVGDAVFVGDTLFMPDVGTARCDFPGGDAAALYRSVHRLLGLPPETRLFMCHDYPPEGRSPVWETTVAEQRAKNIHVHDGVSEAEFVKMRTARDATLAMPNLILPSVQVNIRAGEMPPAEGNGVSYLKIPLNAL